MRNTIDSAFEIPKDFLEMLRPSGIKSLLELMCRAYFDLLQKKIVDVAMDENAITEEWFICLQ